MRIFIVGAGIIGMAIALECSQRHDCEIHVFDTLPCLSNLNEENQNDFVYLRQHGVATVAAAGILGAQVESSSKDDLFELLVSARDAYSSWTTEMVEESGVDVEYIKSGALVLAFSDEEGKELKERCEWQSQAKQPSVYLSSKEAHQLEARLSSEIYGAAYFERDAQVNPVKLRLALSRILSKKKNIVLRRGVKVVSIETKSGRATGIRFVSNSEHEKRWEEADVIVAAAGSWTGLLKLPPELRASVEVKPIRGHVVELKERFTAELSLESMDQKLYNASFLPLRHIIFGSHTYVVPRRDGRILCGTTMEDVGFCKGVEVSGMVQVLSGALRSVPGLSRASFLGAWSGFRPYQAGLPNMGDELLPGLFLATGHGRNGILLAKKTATQVYSSIFAHRS